MAACGISPIDRLPRDAISQDFEALSTLGIEFNLATSIDRDSLASKLAQDFHAVYVGTGADAPCPYPVQVDESSRIVVDPITFSDEHWRSVCRRECGCRIGRTIPDPIDFSR